VWSYHSLQACRCAAESASSGFSGSSMMIMSAPRPVCGGSGFLDSRIS
jgi:hypothetical protein